MDYHVSMNTIVELPEFIKQAGKIFSESLRESLVNYLAAHPKAGVIHGRNRWDKKIQVEKRGDREKWWCQGYLLLLQRQLPSLHNNGI